MKIQFNTDKTILGDESQEQYFTSLIEDRLLRFQSHISRIEVHLSDENGKKEGHNDIQCLMEVRIEGRDPIAVTSQADTAKSAVSDAINKVKSSLETILGRINSNEH